MTRNFTRPSLPREEGAALRAHSGRVLSEMSTLGLLGYVEERLGSPTVFPPGTWLILPLVWLLASEGLAAWLSLKSERRGPPGFRVLRPFGATVLCALVLKLLSNPFSWRQASAFGLMVLAALATLRLFLGLIARSRELDRWEGLRMAAAQGAALFAVHPYIRSALLGAGDASSYSLMVADFLAQIRAGIFPVLIGQSPFAFSGGFHPTRNAPYLQHLAGTIDLLSLGTFNAFALLNLAILASMVGAVLGGYAALRIFMPKSAWAALALAFLYGLCPGALAPLYGGDMVPTFMTLPFLPWLVLGIAKSATQPLRTGPWVLQGAALAALWLAHPPVAAWATFLATAAGMVTVLRTRKIKVLDGILCALALFLVLAGFLFVSVEALKLPVVTRAAALATIDFKMAILRNAWARSLLPVSPNGDSLLGDLQLGYGLWLGLLVAAAWAVRERTGRTLLACFALLLLFAWPVPVATRLAWGGLPTPLLAVTNQWPVERFYVLLDALSVFIIAAALSRAPSSGRGPRVLLSGVLAAACLWSAAESRKFFRRAAVISAPEAISERMHLPENIVVSRTHSYEYLGTPAYFSNGHVDPRLETRLIDREDRKVFADGSTPKPGSAPATRETSSVDLRDPKDGSFPETIELEPGETSILRFDFLGRQPTGELQLTGASLNDVYTLPSSGASKAFGTGPDNAHVLFAENSTSEKETITFRFLGAGADTGDSLAHVTVEPLGAAERAIRVDSLTPFHAGVTADRDSYLETPKLFVPGYRATVDGAPVPLARSPEGLVAIPLVPGEHDVRLDYPGTRLLRWSYFGSGAAWVLLIAAVGVYSQQRERRFQTLPAHLHAVAPAPAGRGKAVGIALLLAAIVAAGFFIRAKLSRPTGRGAVRMSILLPWPQFGRTEPLVTTGRTGAGDFISVTYVDGRHVVVAHDKWSYGGAKSAPIAVDFEKAQDVEIGMSSLGGDAPHPSPSAPRVFVIWNGTLVLSENVAAHPSAPREATFGDNTIGGSSTVPHFSGEILSVAPIDPAGAP